MFIVFLKSAKFFENYIFNYLIYEFQMKISTTI